MFMGEHGNGDAQADTWVRVDICMDMCVHMMKERYVDRHVRGIRTDCKIKMDPSYVWMIMCIDI